MEVVLAGATGLIGGLLLERLLDDPRVSHVTTTGRRSPHGLSSKHTALTGSVDNWPALLADVSAPVAIATLGTTLKQAGSRESFAAVDRDAVAAFAKATHAAGTRHFLMVSSVGAEATASNFYLRTKGEAEEAIRAVGFERLDILRPGLLRGDRRGPPRLGERIASVLSPVTDWLTPARYDRYRSIEATIVADALARLVHARTPGVYIHHNREMG